MTKRLKKNHSEYRELQAKAMRIVEENPAQRILINSMEGIDEQCINNSSEEDPSTYQVTVSLAGVAK